MRPAGKLCVADCVANRVRLAVPQPTERQDIRNQINAAFESIYALLVRSEDRKRALLETILYGLVTLSALAAILQFADQPVSFGA